MRCAHLDPTGEQCRNWYVLQPGTIINFCAHHRGGQNGASEVVTPEARTSFIAEQNIHRVYVKDMTLEQLDAHITTLESALAAYEKETAIRRSTMRAEIGTKKNVQRELIEALSVEEQEARKRMKVSLVIPKAKSDKTLQTEANEAYFRARGLSEEVVKACMKMLKNGMSKEEAYKMLMDD